MDNNENWYHLENSTIIKEWKVDYVKTKFCVWFNFTNNDIIPSKDSITLCTHGSISYSKFVFEYVKNWKSFISVSLLVDENSILALLVYRKLYYCFPEMSRLVATHVVWKQTATSPCNSMFIQEKFLSANFNSFPSNCDIMEYEKFFNHTLKHPYPPNTLRNIARKGALTKYHLIADIENKFSENAAEILNQIIPEYVTNNSVVVIRRFEYDENEMVPKNPNILQNLLNKEKAFPFHIHFAKKYHHIPGLSKWLNYSSFSNTSVRVNKVNYPGYFWEPQLIVLNSHPFHFEGFPIRYIDQQALPYELCRANITFYVVSHVSSFHKGISSKLPISKFSQDPYRVAKGKAISKKFIKYINDFYPDTEKVCGIWYKR